MRQNTMQGIGFRNDEQAFIRAGLFQVLLTKVGLGRPGAEGIRSRILALIAVTYVPLVILSLMQGVAYSGDVKVPFLFDIAETTRFLIVGPLLIASEAIIEPWLIQVTTYIRQRLIRPEDLAEYAKIMDRAITWRDSYVVEVLLFVATFAWQWIDTSFLTATTVSSWRILPSTQAYTYTWYLLAYFAKPLIRFLWLRWLWRYLAWTSLLFMFSRMNLKIMPTHPDRSGGLGFITVGHTKFAVLGFALGAQAASIVGESIISEGRTLLSFRYEILSVVAIVLIVFLLPLLCFTGKLIEAKRVGLFEYGALADDYVCAFKAKWMNAQAEKAELLGSSDIQSLADLDNSYTIVREMKTCLITRDNILIFTVGTLIPCIPLLLSVYPFDDLLKQVLKVVM